MPTEPKLSLPGSALARATSSFSEFIFAAVLATTTEAGLPQYKVDGWFALAAPAGTPRPIMERLNKELADALKDPAVSTSFEKAGAVPIALDLERAKKFHADEIVLYRDVITKAGIPRIE